jgi:hypothetical protein
MATVYLAHDRKHRRRVALKVLHPHLAHALGPDRFLREIDTAANLNHPHILPLHDSGEVDGLLYYVMPFVEGESLRDRLQREPPLPIDEALHLAREVADALGHAHEQGVIHRDIKPENILLSGGHALVADFGIAKALADGNSAAGERLTETGLVIGTPAYMSPEQASGEPDIDGRTDIYSLGCVLYEMLVGAPPFTGPSAQALLAQHALHDVPSLRARHPGVTLGVERAVLKALAKAPADRFANARQLSDALAGGGTLELPAGRARSLRAARIAVGAGLAVLLAVIAVALWKQRTPRRLLDANVVAVAPFSIASADPGLAYLREGMVDLLAAKLTGQGGPRAADPRSVLSAWRRASGSEAGELPRERALIASERLGAGQLLMGNVVGTPRRLVLNASVLAVPGGQARAQTSVEGPADSLPTLVDQLTAKLLTLGAGEGETRLSALTSTSLPAVRAYLEGQALYRHGRYEIATRSFEQALQLDSTFALAAVGLLAAGLRSGAYEPINRGEALAQAGRERLNPRDRAYLLVLIGASYTHTNSYAELLHRAEDFVAVAPDRVEAYAWLAEGLFNFGEMLGIPTAHARAAAAYRRAIELDSTYAPVIDYVLLLSARSRDTATVRRMRNLYRAVGSSPTDMIRWRMAVALGDTAALDSVRARFDSTDVLNLLLIGQVSQYDGVGLADAELAHRAAQRGESRGPYRRATLAEVVTLALNRGRPGVALRVRQQQAEAEPRDPLTNMNRVMDALYWDGDSAAGAAAARELGDFADAQSIDSAPKREAAVCVTQQWRIAHGQLSSARRDIARLQAVTAPQDHPEGVVLAHGCAVLLDALLASAERRPTADVYFGRLDSLMRTGPPYRHFDQPWNLLIARFKEEKGDLQGALAATRRRLYFIAEPVFLSTYLREEGRLAALTGDRTGAIRAYQHYLALRADPEPALQAQVDQVRAELAGLLEKPAP